MKIYLSRDKKYMCVREGGKNRSLARINGDTWICGPCTCALWDPRGPYRTSIRPDYIQCTCLYHEIPLSDLILYTHWSAHTKEFWKLLNT
jgi:hypothetical protein